MTLAKQATALQTRYHIAVDTVFDEEPDASLTIKEVLYRVSQEALNNTVKHANASKIVVSLSGDGGLLGLEISDNGKGFDPNSDFAGHLGLRSMRERLEQVGGTLTITSSSCHGTQITAVVPLA